MRALVLSLAGAVVLALGSAAALDAAGAATISFGLPTCLLGAAVGAAQATLWPKLLLDRRVTPHGALAGALVGAAAAFLLGRGPFGWLDLGAVAAGLPGELPLTLLPFVSVLALIAAWPSAKNATSAKNAKNAKNAT